MKVYLLIEDGVEYQPVISVFSSREKADEFMEFIADKSYKVEEHEVDMSPVQRGFPEGKKFYFAKFGQDDEPEVFRHNPLEDAHYGDHIFEGYENNKRGTYLWAVDEADAVRIAKGRQSKCRLKDKAAVEKLFKDKNDQS